MKSNEIFRKVLLRSDNDIDGMVLQVAKEVCDIVGATLGPGGRPVLIRHLDRPNEVTKDGVTVAKSIGYKDIDKDTIASVIIEASEECGNLAGDGTTTTIILANAFIREINEYLRADKTVSTQALLRQVEAILEAEVIPFIQKQSKEVKNLEELKNVAVISANGDDAIANSLIEAFDLVGEDGEITVEEGFPGRKGFTVTHHLGFSCRKGWKALEVPGPLFINQDTQSFKSSSDVLVACYDGNLEHMRDVVPLMEVVLSDPQGHRKPLIIVAHKFSNEVLTTFLHNKQLLTIYPLLSEANYMPNSASHFLHDLAAYTNGSVFNPVTQPFKNFEDKEMLLSMLGVANGITSTKYQTVFYADPNPEALDNYVQDLKQQIPNLETPIDQDGQRKRISRLIGGIAVINLTAPTPSEFKELKARVDDAMCSIRSAKDEGIVPGGGSTLLRSAIALVNKEKNKINQLIARALMSPIQAILVNAGIVNDQDVLRNILSMGDNAVYDARYHSFKKDGFESGIVDPTKVEIVALRSAMSIANTLSSLGGIVSYHGSEK